MDVNGQSTLQVVVHEPGLGGLGIDLDLPLLETLVSADGSAQTLVDT